MNDLLLYLNIFDLCLDLNYLLLHFFLLMILIFDFFHLLNNMIEFSRNMILILLLIPQRNLILYYYYLKINHLMMHFEIKSLSHYQVELSQCKNFECEIYHLLQLILNVVLFHNFDLE